MKPLYALLFSAGLVVLLAGPAPAYPHETDKLSELREKSKALVDKARESGDAFADSEIMTNMSYKLSALAARIELETGEGAGTALWIDGDELVRFNRGRGIEDTLSITGLGPNLSVERETVIEDGQTRTRIVIEMDGGDNVAINLPGTPPSPETRPRKPQKLLD